MTKYLYRKLRWAVTLAVMLIAAGPGAAQWRAPRPARKTPRAIAVLESLGGSQRLIPVSFFYEGHYYDANLYRATPVPLTLASQTVYEVQHFGLPLGLFTVHSASHAAGLAWFGNGYFKAAALAAKEKKPAAPIVVRDPKRPVLHRRRGSEGDRPVTGSHSTQTAVDDDPDRPRLHYEKTDPPQLAPDDAEAVESADGEHPVLRRGKPAQEQSGADLTSRLLREQVTRQVAVSDAGPSDPRDLHFTCAQAECAQMEAQAGELARVELQRLAAERGLVPAQAKAGSGPQSATLPPLQAEEEQFVAYDLDYRDYATVVYSARFRRADSPGAQSWVVAVVARRDGGKLTKLYSAVSDPRELDLYPEVRFVDAVDPEGYGRYALLLREQKAGGVSWLLGRVTGYQLQTLFETTAR